MAPLDWDSVLSVDSALLKDDEEAAERAFQILAGADLEADSPEASNPQDMVKLFQVAQAVMMVKNVQYETALEELENAMADDKDSDLKAEVEALQKELAHYQKFAGAGDRYLKSEMTQLEDKNKLLEKELEELERKLIKEQRQSDKISKQCEDLELKNTELKRESERLRTNIKDYQRQIESQRENQILRRGEDMTVKDQMSKKNREISSFIDEIRDLQDENDRLQRDINVVQDELKEATVAMNGMADDYSKLKSVLEDTDTLLENMRQERDLLRSQVQDLQQQMQSKTDVDDEIMVAFNKKVDEWKIILASKDEENAQLNEMIIDLQKQLQAARMDTDKNAMAELIQTNQEKDEKIKELRKSLEEASVEMKLITQRIEDTKSKSKEGGPSIRQQLKIDTLNKTLQKEQISTLKERDQVLKLEKDIVERDKMISELRARMMQYEFGQFGLPEAVQEIKEFRTQIKIRDKNIEDLTQTINQVQIELNDYTLENEELRERLGMDPREQLDAGTIRHKKKVKEEQAMALNRVLTKEVERLEEERQQLKKMLRKQAMHRGERAVELGLTTEDLKATEALASSQEPAIRSVNVKEVHADASGLYESYREKSDPEGSMRMEKTTQKTKSQVEKLESDNKLLRDENKQLEIGLREILSMVKDNRFKEEQNGAVELNIPALEKLIAMIESRNAVGQYDVTLKLKGEIEQLNGRNEELRLQLMNSRNDVKDLISQLERKTQKLSELEKEIDLVKEVGQGVIKLNPFQLPEGMTPSSVDIIASLNEFLIQILQELSNREETLKSMEDNLEAYKRKFSVAMHQQSILYTQYMDEKDEREGELKKLRDENNDLAVIRDQDQIRIQEYDRLLETLKRDPDKQKARLSEYSRKITVLRVNEKSLSRRYTILQESETHLRKECNKVKTDITSVENAVTERIGYLTRYKEMATYRIAALQKALDNSVPELELQLANKQYNELTAKYRDLLQKENTLISRSSAVENLEFDLKRLQEVEVNLKKQLHAEKEKSYILEQSMNDLLRKVGGDSRESSIRHDEVTSIARQLATLEMKELNERQRAEHAVRKYEQLRSIVAELENRNNELEQRFAELTKINLESQRVERELREELTNAVPAEINRADKKYIAQLEESEAKLKLEMSRLKEVAEIATHQAETVTSRQQVQEKELTSLRRQLHDIQMESDEKTIIAKLHQHIVAQQVSEATAVRKLEETNAKVKRLEVAILRVEQRLDEKDQILYRTRMEARAKSKFLQKTIQDLRRQFSGALPLIKQEKFAQTLRMLQDCKIQQHVELNVVRSKSQEAEGRSSELEMKLIGLQELIVTLKDGRGAEKVAEWHQRMGEIRLQDMKLRRQLEKREHRIKSLEDENKRLEDSISLLEEENFKQSKEYEDRQLVWEQYEVELERKIARLEKNQDELFVAAQKFEEATGSFVDPTLPVANQLEMAIVKLKEHIKTIIITRAQAKRMKSEVEDNEKKLQEAERKIVSKDKLINELRLRIPISERGAIIKEVENVASENTHEEHHAQNALKVAQSTVESLKLMIRKKEETISKYQEMLKDLREDMKSLEESHKNEMKVMQDRLHLEMEEKIKKLRKMHLDYINAPQPPTASEKQLRRLGDLEETVADQDNNLAVANEKYKKAREEMDKMKEKAEVEHRMYKKKLKMREEEHKAQIEKLSKEIENEQDRVAELNKELEIVNDDLKAAKEANERAPTKTMKSLVERLRNQLALKDKQQKALSQALLQLRRDMVNQAEENVQTHARQAGDELNVQKIVDKQTSALETKIEELQLRQEKLKTEVRQKRESEAALKAELERIKRDNERKETGVKKLAAELKEREELDDQIEDLRAEIKSLEKYKGEAEKLRKRIQVLEEEQQVEIEQIDSVQTGANVDLGFDKAEPPTKDKKSREEVIRWEENKKWQKRIETLRNKLKEKTEECDKADKNIQMLKDIIARNDKEKASLQAKIRSSARPVDEIQLFASTSKEEIVQSLKGRIFQLEDENNELQRRLALDKDNELHELRIQNSQLVESVKALEAELVNRQASDDPDGYDWSMTRERSFQKEILEVRKQNMELKFENDRAQTNIPRLTARVKDLEEYCEILKSELETVKKKEKQRKGAMGTGMGGQSVEDMERVIAAMRRVIERLQSENDNLKKVKSKAPPHSDVARENRQLKQELQKLKSKDGGSVSARGANTTKLVHENDKIRRELKKSNDETETLRNANSSLALEKEKLKKELAKTKDELASANARAPKLEGADSTQWKSVLMTKMSEEKVAKIETELEKKNKLLQDLKNHLRSAAEREAELLRNEEGYKDKISLLERFPSDIKIDSDVVQHLQRARLRIKTLEAEKNELLDDVSRMRELTNDGQHPVRMDEDETLDKLKKYDRLLAVEVELRTKLRAMIVDKEGMMAENSKLKRELESFDPAFFEEIEDLKYNYKKSVERNVLYERQLKQLSRQFGVDVNIPDDDDY